MCSLLRLLAVCSLLRLLAMCSLLRLLAVWICLRGGWQAVHDTIRKCEPAEMYRIMQQMKQLAKHQPVHLKPNDIAPLYFKMACKQNLD